jgi:hypothetical protein
MPRLSTGDFAVAAAANTNNQADCQMPPMINGLRRPNYIGFDNTIINDKEKTINLFHNVYATECTDKVDNSQDDLRDIRVLNADRLEDRSAIVEKVIGSGELL